VVDQRDPLSPSGKLGNERQLTPDEFIELHNASAAAVALFDTNHYNKHLAICAARVDFDFAHQHLDSGGLVFSSWSASIR